MCNSDKCINNSDIQPRLRTRDGGVEFLRCLMMFCVVLCHCECFGVLQPYIRYSWFVSSTIYAVPVFVFISGWFGVRFSFRKILGFIGLGLFASFVALLFSWIHDGRMLFSFTMGWFGNSYLALLLLSPIINAGIDGLSDRGLMSAWVSYTVVMLAAWVPIEGLNVFIDPTGWTARSFNTLLYYYVTGRFLARMRVYERLPFHRVNWLLGFLLILFSTYGMRYLISEFKCYQWVDAYARYCIGYDSPFAVGMAFCLFGFFYKMKVGGGGLSFIVTKLSPSIFSVYLLHDTSSANFGRWLIGLIEHFLYSQYANVPFAIIGAAIGVFFTCCLIDSLRRVFLSLITLARKRAKRSHSFWGF